MEFLYNLDVDIFRFVNQSISNSFFDWLLPWCREKLLWVPLYVFLLLSTILHYKKSAYILIVSSVLTILISDQLSSFVIKPTVQRLRPCNNEILAQDINVLAPCRNSFSFTSSHATNHFAVATFFILILGPFVRGIKMLWLWAFLVAFSQVYVGLHYPFDILVGGIIGVIIAWSVYKLVEGFYLIPIHGVRKS